MPFFETERREHGDKVYGRSWGLHWPTPSQGFRRMQGEMEDNDAHVQDKNTHRELIYRAARQLYHHATSSTIDTQVSHRVLVTTF